jgi:hypothetical protein
MPGELAAIRLHHARFFRTGDLALPAAMGTRLRGIEPFRLTTDGLPQESVKERVKQRSGLPFQVCQRRFQIRSLFTIGFQRRLPTKLPTGFHQLGQIGLGQAGNLNGHVASSLKQWERSTVTRTTTFEN